LKWALDEPTPDEVFRPSWAVLGMQAAYDRDAARGVEETYEFRVGDEIFHARVHDGEVQARHGAAHEPDLVISAEPDAFEDLVAGRATFAQATKRGSINAEGPRGALNNCSAIFRRPEVATRAAA
jgi:hypothetical protein